MTAFLETTDEQSCSVIFITDDSGPFSTIVKVCSVYPSFLCPDANIWVDKLSSKHNQTQFTSLLKTTYFAKHEAQEKFS